jgi:hypothetical protein
MRTRVPALLTRGLSAPQRIDVTSWWRGLAPADRQKLGAGRRAGVVGRFVEPGSQDPHDEDDGRRERTVVFRALGRSVSVWRSVA